MLEVVHDLKAQASAQDPAALERSLALLPALTACGSELEGTETANQAAGTCNSVLLSMNPSTYMMTHIEFRLLNLFIPLI